MRFLVLAVLLAATGIAHADDRHPVAGFRVRGHSKVKERTLSYLAHVGLGERVGANDIPRLEQALVSSELFESVKVTLEPTGQGDEVLVVATVEDKLSWIVGPTVYLLSTNQAVGVGFVENDLGGRDQKLILYGQLGTQTSILFATFLDPSVHGTKWQYRVDTYLERRQIDEYANPRLDPTDQTIERTTRETFLDAGALVGYQFKWWLIGSLRLRGARVYFRDPHDPTTGAPLQRPEIDGWDVTFQTRLTADHRYHRFGVTWGPFVDLLIEPSVPGLDTYGYANSLLRAYYSWLLFDDHQLEVRTVDFLGAHMPFHEDNTLGGVGDLRGYPTDQFRGDLNILLRAEYSVPLFQWWKFKFRGLGFYDWGYCDFLLPRPDGVDRHYLPNQLDHPFIRDNIGLGLRVYVKAVVLPLLGLDVAYGIQARSPQIVFELGLTDF